MSDKPGIVIAGASGRMGQMLISEVLASDRMTLVGAFERKGHDWVGQDLGEMMGGAANGIIVSDDPAATIAGSQAVIDFTTPAASVANANFAAGTGAVHVIGTTGMTEEDLEHIRRAAAQAVIVQAGNMSLGVNLLVQLTRQVAAALDLCNKVG